MADTRLTIDHLFDPNYYRQQNPDLAGLSDAQARRHFDIYGLIEEREFSPFFNFAFYQQQNTDLVAGRTARQALQTFFDIGLPQGRTFSPFIDLNYYRASNPDLGGLDNNQLFKHLIDYALPEGRSFYPLLDLNYYRANNPDLAGLDNRQLFNHFINQGLDEGRPSLPLFDVNFYRAINPDLSLSTAPNPGYTTNQQFVEHFLRAGLSEGRRFSPYLDVDYYLRSNQDLVVAFDYNRNPQQARQLAFQHLLGRGIDERRRFSQFFDINYYLASNPDLRAVGLTPRQAFNHFINNGLNEGRRPSQIFDPVFYVANNPDLLAAQFPYKEALQDFEVELLRPRSFDPSNPGRPTVRPGSIFFQPEDIAPLLYVPVEDISQPPPLYQWLQNADRWGDIPVGGTLTYSFVTSASAFLYEGSEPNVRELTPAVKNNIRDIMRTYGQYLGINFVEVPDRPPNVGRLRFMFSDGPNANPRDGNIFAYAYLPSDFPGSGLAGDVHLNPNRNLINFEEGPGSFAYQTILHEIGHALGLKHPFQEGQGEQPASEDRRPTLPVGKDNNTNTVMTYNFFPFSPQQYNGSFSITPMSYDIRALQYLYGASYLNIEDTVYRFDINNFIGPNERDGRNGIKQTIWDAGGVDTLDFSALPPILAGYYFDMNEGGVNTTQIALNGSTYLIGRDDPEDPDDGNPPPLPITTNSFGTTIGFGALIENLIGSQGDDQILGTNLPNGIASGSGDDTITSGYGPDILSGGDGSDIFVESAGDGGPTPGFADIIVDFQPGVDKIGLGFGVPLGAISITQGTGAFANDTLIRIASTGEYLAALRNIPAGAITFNDFTFV